MIELLQRWPLWKLRALARIAKTHGKAFFRDPSTMRELRSVLRVKEMLHGTQNR